jgi:N-acetylated-alpha-linked acidic dipeptidase
MPIVYIAKEQYYPFMNTPVDSQLTLYSEPPFHAQLKEDILEGDPDSQLRDEVRAFHGLSANGDVTAKYVYAGYGRKRDYELLAEHGESCDSLLDEHGMRHVPVLNQAYRELQH